MLYWLDICEEPGDLVAEGSIHGSEELMRKVKKAKRAMKSKSDVFCRVDAVVAPKARSARNSVMSEPRGSHSFFAVRRRADRTVTLSQIVHLRAPSHEYTLRCMLNRTLILITSAA